MLAYFPVPYPDELLYSVIARYAVHTGLAHNQKAVLRDVYGKTSAVAIPDIPSHLNAIVENVQNVWQTTAIQLIQQNTLAPLYYPFLPTEKVKQVTASMVSTNGGGIHTRCGIAASSVKQTEFFRYCPACVEEQMADYGECYWQRRHQVAGMQVCLKHSCRLIITDLSFHPKQKHLYQSANSTVIRNKPDTVHLQTIEKLLLSRVKELLELNSLKGHSSHQWTQFYQNLASHHGLKTKSRIDHFKVRQKLMRDWSNTSFRAELLGEKGANWLTQIFRKHRTSFHPVRHLMVLCSFFPNRGMDEAFRLIESFPYEEKKSKFIQIKEVGNDLLKVKRQAWLRLMKKHAGDGIKELRRKFPGGALYAWLYRNDIKWLMDNRPSRVRYAKNRYKADYDAWDDFNVVALEKERNSLIKAEIRPRLSSTLLIKQLPRANSVEKHLSDLPKTSAWLVQYAENLENYQRYRLKKAAEYLRKRYIQIKRWRLLRIAGIRKTSVTPALEKFIQQLELTGNISH